MLRGGVREVWGDRPTGTADFCQLSWGQPVQGPLCSHRVPASPPSLAACWAGRGCTLGSGREERLIRKEYVKNIRKKKSSHRVLSDGVSLPLSQRPRTPEGCRAVWGRAAALPALVVSRPRLPAAPELRR